MTTKHEASPTDETYKAEHKVIYTFLTDTCASPISSPIYIKTPVTPADPTHWPYTYRSKKF